MEKEGRKKNPMSDFWMTKTQDGSGLVLKNDLNNAVTTSSLGGRVTVLEQTQLLTPIIVNIAWSSNISTQPNQIFNALIVIGFNIDQLCNLTLPSISSLVSYDTNATVGKGYYVTIINTGEGEGYVQLITVTGYTLVGSPYIYTGSSGRFYFAYTNVTSGQQAITIYRVS